MWLSRSLTPLSMSLFSFMSLRRFLRQIYFVQVQHGQHVNNEQYAYGQLQLPRERNHRLFTFIAYIVLLHCGKENVLYTVCVHTTYSLISRFCRVSTRKFRYVWKKGYIFFVDKIIRGKSQFPFSKENKKKVNVMLFQRKFRFGHLGFYFFIYFLQCLQKQSSLEPVLNHLFVFLGNWLLPRIILSTKNM